MYQLGAEAPEVPAISWWYCDETKAGNETIKKGQVVFVDGLPVPGDYQARLYSNDGYELLYSVEFSVSERPTISPSKDSFSFEEKITLNFYEPKSDSTGLDWYLQCRRRSTGHSLHNVVVHRRHKNRESTN